MSSIFCSCELARRVEAAERDLIGDSATAAAQRGAEEVLVRPVAGGVAVWAREGSPLDKVVGLGFAGVPDPSELDDLEHEIARRGADVRVELSTLADPAVAALLSDRGYRLVGFENVLGLRLERDRPVLPPTAPEVRPAAADGSDGWLDVVVDGFAHPDESGAGSHEEFPREIVSTAIADMATATGFQRFTASIGSRVVGGGSMRLHDGVAILCGAATLPAFRRRGAQGALLAYRLRTAQRDGCDLAVVTTLPGSASQQNAQRHGFELLYSRAVLVRESPQRKVPDRR